MLVAIIPARGGSKGVSDKNLQYLGSTTLLQWTLYSAVESKHVQRIYITTDIAEPDLGGIPSYGHPVSVLPRPPELARDEVQVDEVVLFALRQICGLGEEPDTVVVLQPTSPFRTAEHIDEAIELFNLFRPRDLGGICPTVFGMESGDGFYYMASEGKAATPIGHDPKNRLGRQYTDFYQDEVLRENGSIYIVSAKRLSEERSFRLEPIIPYRMGRMASHEIDTPADLEMARWMLENKELFA